MENKMNNIESIDIQIKELKDEIASIYAEISNEKDSSKIIELSNQIDEKNADIKKLEAAKKIVKKANKKTLKVENKEHNPGIIRRNIKKIAIVIVAVGVISVASKCGYDKLNEKKEVPSIVQEDNNGVNAQTDSTIDAKEDINEQIIQELVKAGLLSEEDLMKYRALGLSNEEIINYCIAKNPAGINIINQFIINHGTIHGGIKANIDAKVGCDDCELDKDKSTKKTESKKPTTPSKTKEQPKKEDKKEDKKEEPKKEDKKEEDKDKKSEIDRIVNAFAVYGYDSGIRDIECDPLDYVTINLSKKADEEEVIKLGLEAFAKAQAEGAQVRKLILDGKRAVQANPYDNSIKYTKKSLLEDTVLDLIDTKADLNQEYIKEIKLDSNGRIITNESKVIEETVKEGNKTTNTKTYINETIDPKTGEGKKSTTTIITEVEENDKEATIVNPHDYENKNKNEGIIIDPKKFEEYEAPAQEEELESDDFYYDEQGRKIKFSANAELKSLKQLRDLIAYEVQKDEKVKVIG